MLREAYVIGGAAVGVGTIAVCTGKRWFAFAMEPLLALAFRCETRRRLRALASHLARVRS